MKSIKNYILSLCVLLLVSIAPNQAKVIYPAFDDTISLKEDVIEKLTQFMGPNGSVRYIVESSKVILWTNEAAILERECTYISTTLPSFTMPTAKNRDHLQKVIFDQTGELIPLQDIGGILIAHPLQGAIMYYREGYLGKGPYEEDGRVSPAVIIYHEFSHAKDSLISPEYFTEMAASFNKRYLNDAEESAVQQQNDLLLTAKFYGYDLGELRQSYGKNDLLMVTSPWEIP